MGGFSNRILSFCHLGVSFHLMKLCGSSSFSILSSKWVLNLQDVGRISLLEMSLGLFFCGDLGSFFHLMKLRGSSPISILHLQDAGEISHFLEMVS